MCTAHLSPVVRLLEEEWQDRPSLSDDVWEALIRTGYGPLKTIELQSDGATITLVGTVSTYFLKQVAQTAALSVAGVVRIKNELCVVSPR